MRSILDKQHSPLPISTETSMSSTDNWRTRSQFSEQMTSVQITLPDRFTWLRILGMIIGLITFFSCIFLTLETLVSETTQKDSHRPSLSIFPSYSNALSSPFSNTGVNQSTSKEAYVLFLPSIDRPEYIQSIRILIYGYKYDAETRDETRDVVVMTTPQVPACIEDQLRNEGAIIIRNNLITSIPNPHSTSNSQHPWKDQYNKLLIWNLTQYDQVLYTDADMLMSRSMKEIWNDPGVRYSKESGIGLAARFMRFSGQSDDYLNAGFLVVTPNRTMFEAILEVRGFENGMRDMEQVSSISKVRKLGSFC